VTRSLVILVQVRETQSSKVFVFMVSVFDTIMEQPSVAVDVTNSSDSLCFHTGITANMAQVEDVQHDTSHFPCIDSGAGGHIFDKLPANCYLIPGTKRATSCTIITSKAGATLPADCKADVVLQSNVMDSSSTGLLLRSTLLGVKGLVRPLISVSCLSVDGVTMIFRSNTCLVLDNTRKLIVIAVCTNNLYVIPIDRKHLDTMLGKATVDSIVFDFNTATPEIAIFSMNTVFVPSNFSNVLELLHHRYGCLNYKTIKRHWGATTSSSKKAIIPFCKTCGETQMKKSSFKTLPTPNLKPGDRIDHDWIPGPCRSRRGYIGAEFLIDRASSYVTIILCKAKSDSQAATKDHKKAVETLFERNLKILKGDSSRENTGTLTESECKSTGTERNWSNPYDKQQSGFHERHIGLWKGVIRAIIKYAMLPNGLYDYAWLYAMWIRRFTPKVMENGEVTNSSLFYHAGEVSPFSVMLRVFGCEAFGLIPAEKRTDTINRSFHGVFLGFAPGIKAY
jgi:hypothetical protein